MKAKNYRQIDDFIQNKELLYRFNLNDSWNTPCRNIDSVFEWFFSLFEPKCNIIWVKDLKQLKKISNGKKTVFLIKQNNGVTKSACRNELLKLTYD